MNILVAVPAYRNEIKAGTTSSIVGVFPLFASMNIQASLLTAANADVVTVRNLYGTIMMDTPSYTHLLFIDNDMEFRPDAIRRMIAADVPLIGIVAPKRGLDLQRLYDSARTKSLPQALSSAMQFNVYADKGRDVKLASGIGIVDGVGLSISLITRDVFAQLAANPAIRREQNPIATQGAFARRLYGFFDHIITPDGGMIPEDYAFCERWRTLCGGEVRALFDEEVGHHGDFIYRAKFPGVP